MGPFRNYACCGTSRLVWFVTSLGRACMYYNRGRDHIASTHSLAGPLPTALPGDLIAEMPCP